MTTQVQGLPKWRQGITPDLPTYKETTAPPSRPFWWMNRAHRGEPGFFLTAYLEDEQLFKPWEQAQVFKGETHWKAVGVRFAPVCWRVRPFEWRDGKDGRKMRHFLKEWPKDRTAADPKFQGYTEVIGFIAGDPDQRVWRMTGDGMIGIRYGVILDQYRDGLLSWARRTHAENVPTWAFYLPITVDKDVNGQTIFTETGFGSTVQLPMLAFPKKANAELADLLYVGDDILHRGYTVRDEHDDWLNRWQEEAE